MRQDTSLIEVPARFSSLDILLDRVATACKSAGFDVEFSRRAELVIEELFANTINHGYGGESDQPVWIKASPTEVGLFVEYQDACPPFDPLKPVATPTYLDPDRSVGGFGRRLIVDLATTSTYKRQDGRNVVSFEFFRKA